MAIFDLAGSGQAIVFLHAALGDRRMWWPQMHVFALSNQVIAIDSAGFGDAEPCAEPFNRADDVVSLLDDLGIEHAVLVGGSMGGRVAAEIAVVYPERVSALMLIGAARAGHDWSPPVQQMWQQESDALDAGDVDAAVEVNLTFWLDGPGRERASLSDQDRALVAAMQRRAFEHELAHPEAAPERRRADVFERIGEITVPTSVLFGTDDPPDIAEIARWYQAEIAGASLHEIENAAHLPSLEQPERCNELLRELLALVRPGT